MAFYSKHSATADLWNHGRCMQTLQFNSVWFIQNVQGALCCRLQILQY